MIRRLASASVVILAASLGWGGAAGAETLEEALVKAYQNNPTLQAQRARLRAIDEQVPQALSNWRPSVVARGSAGKQDVDTHANSDSGSVAQVRTPAAVSFEVVQNLYRGGRTLADTRRARNTVQAERAQLRRIEQSVLLDSITAYMNVVRDQAVLDLNVNNEQVLARQLEAARDRFRVGEITRTDVSQAEARLARAKADRIGAEGNVQSSRATYRRLIGEFPDRPEAPKQLGELPASGEQAFQRASTSNPSVVSADFEGQAARDNVELISGEFLPTVTLEGTLSRNDDASAKDSEQDSAQILARLTVPIYQQGAVHSRVRAAKESVGQAMANLDAARRSAIESANRAWQNLETARAQIVAFEAQVKAAEVALDGVQREAQVGSRTVLDVLDAEQELLDARVSLVRVQRDEVVAAFDLRSAMGDLTAEALRLPVQPYDFDSHYQAIRNQWWGTEPATR
ncbi:MAG: TolC family outer membrane protein [Proteobacteria bacterium]|nr:TolC family outer membrane protein [Pseudomonadota bacterium]